MGSNGLEGGISIQDMHGVRLVAVKRGLSKRQSDMRDEQRAWYLSENIRWTRTRSQKTTQRGNCPSRRPSGRWGKRNGKISGETTKSGPRCDEIPTCTCARASRSVPSPKEAVAMRSSLPIIIGSGDIWGVDSTAWAGVI